MNQVSLRTTEVIAIEINSIKDQTKRIFLSASIEIGRRLVEAKGMIQHGEFAIWLKDNVDYSQSTANNLMRVFEEYGSDQLSLFGGDTKSQAYENLSYSQAIALLVLPGEEREQFIGETNVEEMSTRDLQAAIKERQQAVKEKEDAEKAKVTAEKAAEKERKIREKLETQQNDHEAIVQRLQKQVEEAQAAGDSGDEEAAEALRESLSKSERQLIDSQDKIKQLEEALKAKPVEVTTATEIVYQTPDDVLAELEALKTESEALKKQVASGTSEETAVFKAHFKTLNDSFNNVLTAIDVVGKSDPEMGAKYKEAIGKLLERMKGTLNVLLR
ncbi:DUF3102 domain-containing protein [Paenibacillus monticola]|uniref:DUF3102 domain-containing protein n=1 Tax=Paenibacillus monticola TaxID=2666075 RepID=A0A7X2H1S5_9BACL|nr:DUF3102 domain-containing protein [Paenibacillus monticola]MRN51965.1 DUF3102 domain-containing protein [Paenibacillus monticola]